MFIDKVRHLEQQNKVLETELVTLRQRQSEPSRVAQLYQQEMRDLRSELEELNREKNRILIERNNMEDELQVDEPRPHTITICFGQTFMVLCYVVVSVSSGSQELYPDVLVLSFLLTCTVTISCVLQTLEAQCKV